MEVSVTSDAISSFAYSTQSLGISNFFPHLTHNVLSLTYTSSDQPPPSPIPFHISAASPPPTRTLTRRRLRTTRYAKRKILVDDDDGEENGFYVFSEGGDFNIGDGNFGSGGGGKGWNFGGHGGPNWEDFSDNSISDPAFDFVYEILCWIAMSNGLHFAFKRVVRFVADGFGDRGKVPMRLSPVC